MDSKRYPSSFPPCAMLKLEQTLPSAILREKRRKEKKLDSRQSSTTSLLVDADTVHYRSIGDITRRSDGSLTESESTVGPQPPPLRALLRMPRVLIAVINYGFLTFCDMSLQTLTPLMWSTSLEHEGLGFTPYTIGLAFGIYGIVSVFIQVTLLARIIRCFGPRKVYIVTFIGFLTSFSCFPLERYLARCAGGVDWRVWIVVTVHLTMYSMMSACDRELIFMQMPANIQ